MLDFPENTLPGQLPVVPKNEAGIPMHDYQEYARHWILTHPGCGLFLTMGLGKTRTTLAALYDLNPNGHVLVIAPKNVARGTWQDEIDKLNLCLRTRSFVIDEKTGKDLSRKKRLERYAEIQTAPPTIYFINRELVTDLVKNMPVINGRPIWYFPVVVADELQSFKSHQAARFKALKRVRPCITNFIGLTGTPTPEGLMDLWAQVYLMDMGQRLGKTITEYRNRWFHPTVYANGYPVKYEPNEGAEEQIYAAISDIVISMKSNLNLPPVTYNNIWAYLDKDEMERYKDFAKTQVFQDGDVEITAVNAAVLQNKLSQMASGALYTDAKTHTYQKVHEKKLDLLEYVLGNTDPPVMVAYYFQSDLDMILNRFPSAKVFDGTPQMTKEWNEKRIPMMLIQPASSGRGSNLQFGGHTMVWYTLPWNLEDYLQCNARLYRQGQTEPTVIHHLMVHGTIDEKILKSIERKDMSQTELMNAVQATIDLAFADA